MEGWICPKCGAALAPTTGFCPFCWARELARKGPDCIAGPEVHESVKEAPVVGKPADILDEWLNGAREAGDGGR